MKLIKYPDGTSYVNGTKLGQQVFKLNEYSDIWKLKQFVDAFHSKYSTLTATVKPNIIIPNLIDAQADRRFNKGESCGLKLVLQELASMKANFSIFHPHNPEVVEMAFEVLGSNVNIIDNSEFIQKVLYDLDEYAKYVKLDNNSYSNLILMSADAGGFKPLMKLCDKIDWRGNTFMAGKARKYENEESVLNQIIDREDFKGEDVLIVDDLSVFGGTFKGLATILRKKNVGKLYLAVSHMTMQNLGTDPVTNYYDKVFTTNSKFDTYFSHTTKPSYGDGVIVPENLEIIKLFKL